MEANLSNDGPHLTLQTWSGGLPYEEKELALVIFPFFQSKLNDEASLHIGLFELFPLLYGG